MLGRMQPTHPPAGRILVVDDDADILELMIAQLETSVDSIRSAGSVAEVYEELAKEPVDVVVLDLNLPDGDGLALCRELRDQGFANGIIMVTARDGAVDRVLGLELGADDYLTKPFEPRELVARVRNLVKRVGTSDSARRPNARYASFGRWRLDLLQRRLEASDGRLVILSSTEFRVLSRLVETPNQVQSRESLMPERGATVAYDRSIDLCISRLRQKLKGDDDSDGLILTVRNEGYLLASEVTYA